MNSSLWDNISLCCIFMPKPCANSGALQALNAQELASAFGAATCTSCPDRFFEVLETYWCSSQGHPSAHFPTRSASALTRDTNAITLQSKSLFISRSSRKTCIFESSSIRNGFPESEELFRNFAESQHDLSKFCNGKTCRQMADGWPSLVETYFTVTLTIHSSLV